MSNFGHDRVLIPVGMFFERCERTIPIIVMPIMINGDLCRYLRLKKILPIDQLIKFAKEIAQGDSSIMLLDDLNSFQILFA